MRGSRLRHGKIIWTFEVLKNDPKSWGGDSRLSGGGGAWMPGFYDAQTNTVFYGTANPAPDYDWGNARPGDNLYTSSVVALDPDTGKLKWYHQQVPHDVWDYDAAAGQFMMIDHDGKTPRWVRRIMPAHGWSVTGSPTPTARRPA